MIFLVFFYFKGQKHKILKNRDSRLVELILRLLAFSIFIFINNWGLPHTREVWSIFDQKWCVVTSQNRSYIKIFGRILKKSRTMSNCCMRRSAKFHVDSDVRFLAIANIREGGVKRPPPVKRGLEMRSQTVFEF